MDKRELERLLRDEARRRGWQGLFKPEQAASLRRRLDPRGATLTWRGWQWVGAAAAAALAFVVWTPRPSLPPDASLLASVHGTYVAQLPHKSDGAAAERYFVGVDARPASYLRIVGVDECGQIEDLAIDHFGDDETLLPTGLDAVCGGYEMYWINQDRRDSSACAYVVLATQAPVSPAELAEVRESVALRGCTDCRHAVEHVANELEQRFNAETRLAWR